MFWYDSGKVSRQGFGLGLGFGFCVNFSYPNKIDFFENFMLDFLQNFTILEDVKIHRI